MLAARTISSLQKNISSRLLIYNICLLQKKYLSVKGQQDAEEIIQALNRRISEYRKYLGRNSHNTYLGKKALSAVEILSKELADVQQMTKTKTPPAVPYSVSIEIISNGTAHLRPCVVIHTNYKDYMFNCPEGTSRFLAANRLKAINLTDIFFTRDTWEHFAGVSGLLKTPVASSSSKIERVIRLHGSHNKMKYFELQNDHNDADFPSTLTTRVEERPLNYGLYSDDALIVHFIPISTFSAPQRSVQEKLDIAFLVELKAPQRSLDIKKIKQLKIPGGPHMKQLKDGIDVRLPDGRLIKAEDVLSNLKAKPAHSCLVVECSDMRKLPSLRNNTLLRDYNNGSKILRYIVHFTENSILNTEEYRSWMTSFDESAEHIIVNGSGPCLPHIESLYRINVILNNICPKFFPLLHPKGFNGTIQQDDDCEKIGNCFYARPFQRFFLRKPVNLEPTPPNVSLILTDLLLQLREDPITSEAINIFTRKSSMLESSDSWPRICFLGTSSAVPTSFRNVSAYFLQFNENSCIFVDCGEGSYGQLRILFGDKVCEDLLLKLGAVFITHGHQDHYHGIFTIVHSRRELFRKRGITYKPLVVAAGNHVLKVFRDVDRSFGNYTRDMHIVDISKLLWTLSQEKKSSVEAADLTAEISSEIAAVDLGFKSVIAVKVNHSRTAVGYVFTDLENRKFVFSGDTMPCEQLVKHGKDALVLVHESTFADDEEAHALYKKHSTMKQAFDVSIKMGAKNLVLTHFSAKYPKVPPLPDYIEKAGNVTIAMDNMVVTPSDLALSPQLIPVFRAVFAKEIIEIRQRSLKRHIQEDILARTFVDTLGDTVGKRKVSENLTFVDQIPTRTS